MTLTNAQQQLVEENLGLVRAVIGRCVSNPGKTGSLDYDDLYQIGCIGLCKAAHAFVPDKAKFPTYAYVLIRNEIYRALEHASYSKKYEQLEDDMDARPELSQPDEMAAVNIRTDLRAIQQRLSGVARKGIEVILLQGEGQTCQDISALYNVPSNYISAWSAKARKMLAQEEGYAKRG